MTRTVTRERFFHQTEEEDEEGLEEGGIRI